MTCVEMPLRELGRRAVELVLDNPWDVPIHETLQETIRVSPGATVAAPPPGARGPGQTAYIKVPADS
jgi:DNA-binding LacI/PurR family transcriptional regulator